MYSYDRRTVKTGAVPNTYADEMDAAYIAQHVITYGKSSGWGPPSDPMEQNLARAIEHTLSRYNIGLVDNNGTTWGHKPGGSHVFR